MLNELEYGETEGAQDDGIEPFGAIDRLRRKKQRPSRGLLLIGTIKRRTDDFEEASTSWLRKAVIDATHSIRNLIPCSDYRIVLEL